MVEDNVVQSATGAELVSTKSVNFELNQVVFLQGIRFRISYFNSGKQRITLEYLPYSRKEIDEITEKQKKEEEQDRVKRERTDQLIKGVEIGNPREGKDRNKEDLK